MEQAEKKKHFRLSRHSGPPCVDDTKREAGHSDCPPPGPCNKNFPMTFQGKYCILESRADTLTAVAAQGWRSVL